MSWRLKASNASTPTWSTVLDTQTGQTFTSRFEKKTYDFANATVYKSKRSPKRRKRSPKRLVYGFAMAVA